MRLSKICLLEEAALEPRVHGNGEADEKRKTEEEISKHDCKVY